MSQAKSPFTDDRVASLLGTVINALIKDETKTSFVPGNKYVCQIKFTAQDEYLELDSTHISRLVTEKPKTINDFGILHPESVSILHDRIWQAFHASDLKDTAPLKLALEVIESCIERGES